MLGPAVRYDHVGLALSGVEILRDINFSIAAGEIHCIIGPNGGGKTSLIRCLLGQMPHTGTLSIDWGDSSTIGYVPQFLDFDKTLPVTVSDFMAMVSDQHRPAFLGPNSRRRPQVEAALDTVGLNGKRKTKIGSLSGGERQRVLFAQALIPEPALLVLDEPMTSMDEVGAEVFLNTIKQLAERGVTIAWVAHDLDQVRAAADTVSCVNQTILFSGTPQAVLGDYSAEELFRSAAAVNAMQGSAP